MRTEQANHFKAPLSGARFLEGVRLHPIRGSDRRQVFAVGADGFIQFDQP